MQRTIFFASAILITFAVGILPLAAEVRQCYVDRVEEPAALPYRFQELWKSSHKEAPEIFVPLKMSGDSSSFLCVISSDWVGEGTLSSLIFYSEFNKSNTVSQVNFAGVNKIVHHCVGDFDNDGIEGVAVSFRTGDSLWLALVERSGALIYKRCLWVGTDGNGDGVWDGDGPLHCIHDLNGDSIPEILLEVRSGYDLHPRMLQCIDFARDTVLWEYELAGFAGQIRIAELQPSGEEVILIGTRGPTNGATAGARVDWKSYLIALDRSGRELWWREMSTEYTLVWPLPVDIDADGDLEVFGAYSYCHERDSSGNCLVWGGAYKIFDHEGSMLDSVNLGPGRSVLQAIASDLEMDGLSEVLLSLADSTIILYDHRIKPETVCRFYSPANLWDALDFLTGNERQLLVLTDDSKAWLLDRQFRPLAQYDEARWNGTVKPFKCSRRNTNHGLVLSLEFEEPTVCLCLEETPWFFVFYRRPELAFLAAFLPMAVIAGGITLYSHTIRRKNRIISNTRDQLQQAIDELRLTQQQLIQAEKQKQMKVIAGGVAHEVHNALCPAVNSLEVLKGKLGNSASTPTRLIDLIEAAVSRAMRMTDLVRDFAKLDSEQQTEALSLRALVDEIILNFKSELESNDISVAVDIPESLTFTGVRIHLQSLLSNLIGNAVDALSAVDSRRITITAGQINEKVKITVADSGAGIAAESLPRLFEPFYTTKPGLGTGLGLTIVRRVVDLYEGEIEVDSESGAGAQFVVSLPIKTSKGGK